MAHLRSGSAGAHQPRNPSPPRPAPGQPPPAHRAAQWSPLLIPRHADHLLRRRDRHGRQHLSRRPQRCPNADAVELRPQRRLLARESAASLPAHHDRPRVPLRIDQRRSAAEQLALTAVVDEAHDRSAQALQGVRPRNARVSSSGEPQGPHVHPQVRRRDDPRRGEPVAFRPGRRARSFGVQGDGSRGALRSHRVPLDRRASLFRHSRPARLLLVQAQAWKDGSCDRSGTCSARPSG